MDPTSWTERYQAVLWSAMAVAVILLAVAAVRAIRTPSVESSAGA